MVKLKLRVCDVPNHIAIENGLYIIRKSAEKIIMREISTEIYLRDTINFGISRSISGMVFRFFMVQNYKIVLKTQIFYHIYCKFAIICSI